MESIEFLPREEIEKIQLDKLSKLLLHAAANVPYWHRVLREVDVVKNERVFLSNFARIPPLTIEIIRRENAELCSRDMNERGWYRENSGGSTGVPVEFIQDKSHKETYWANQQLLYHRMLGYYEGDKQVLLWGSERDIITDSESYRNRLLNFLFNRVFLNSFSDRRECQFRKLVRCNLKPCP